MKKLLVLVFSILVSFNSYGGWMKISDSTDGATHYIDIDTLKKHNGYVYYWTLRDDIEPNKYGDISQKLYFQGDCGVSRLKYLSYIYYKEPMGRGDSEVDNTSSEWIYPPPESILGILLNQVCEYTK